MVRACVLLAAAALALTGCGGDGDDARPSGPPDAVVWAVGDAATPGPAPRPLAQRITGSDFDRLLYLGDVYENGTRREFRQNYEPLYGRVARRTLPVIGDHEAANRRRGYLPYWRRKLGRAPARWYATRLGDWELVALDTEAPHGEGSEQVRWLREHVQAGGATTCRIAFWHRPRYSAGTMHGDQEDVAPLWEALRGRAVAVISGNEHGMQRLKPADGVVQFVSGAGGRPLYRIDPDDRVAFADDDHFGALRIELRGRSAQYEFVTEDGEVLDRGELRCER